MYELTREQDLNHTPKLRALLIDYISCMYEEDSDFSGESIWREYCLLKKNNELDILFHQEYLQSPLHWDERAI
jgi:hypothetical protein